MRPPPDAYWSIGKRLARRGLALVPLGRAAGYADLWCTLRRGAAHGLTSIEPPRKRVGESHWRAITAKREEQIGCETFLLAEDAISRLFLLSFPEGKVLTALFCLTPRSLFRSPVFSAQTHLSENIRRWISCRWNILCVSLLPFLAAPSFLSTSIPYFSLPLFFLRGKQREREVANEVNLLGRRKIGGRKVAQGATRMRGHLHKYGPRNLHDPARFVIFRS